MPCGLVVLLPARNCAADLPDWFRSLETYTDAVVALDDGSTDDTAAVLASHPLTATLLRNPVRPTFEGWDDRANRQALVDACAPLEPAWVLELDADERLAEGDGPALRAAIQSGDLDPTAGYTLQVLRVVDLEEATGAGVAGHERVEHYDQDRLKVGRLFAWRPGVRLPDQRLHLVPLPDDIPPARLLPTTLRICHHGSRTRDRRLARVAKYREADPGDEWGTGYQRLLAEPGALRPVRPRPPGLPVVANTAWPGEPAAAAAHPEGEPLLTAVVIARDEEALVHRALAGLLSQETTFPVQFVVVTSGGRGVGDRLAARYPEVEVVELDRPALPGEARNAGLARARGRYVTFPGTHVVMAPGALAARVAWHRQGWGMVTGITDAGTRTPAGWASYFLDHSGGLPERTSHAMAVAPSYASYLTDAVRYVGCFPPDMRTAEDTLVNNALYGMGYGAWRGEDVRMVHHSPCVDVRTLLRHHYRRGRGRGTMLLRTHRPDGGPLITTQMLVNLGLRDVPGRMRRIRGNLKAHGGSLRRRWLVVSPLVLAGAVAAWVGMWVELLRPVPGRRRVLLGDPAVEPPVSARVRRVLARQLTRLR